MNATSNSACGPEIERVDLHRPEHQSAVLTLINDYSNTEFGKGRPLPAAVTERLVEGLAECRNYWGFVAWQEGSPVGLANCFTGFSTFKAQRLLNVHDLCVHHLWRGKGIGRKLLEHVSESALAEGFCRITLEVRSDNLVAKRLYHSMGFACDAPAGRSMEFLTKTLAGADHE